MGDDIMVQMFSRNNHKTRVVTGSGLKTDSGRRDPVVSEDFPANILGDLSEVNIPHNVGKKRVSRITVRPSVQEILARNPRKRVAGPVPARKKNEVVPVRWNPIKIRTLEETRNECKKKETFLGQLVRGDQTLTHGDIYGSSDSDDDTSSSSSSSESEDDKYTGEQVGVVPPKRMTRILPSSNSESGEDKVNGTFPIPATINKILPGKSSWKKLEVQKTKNKDTKKVVGTNKSQQMPTKASKFKGDIIQRKPDVQKDNKLFKGRFQLQQQKGTAYQEVHTENITSGSVDKLDKDIETVQKELKQLRDKLDVMAQTKRKYYDGTDENLPRAEKRRRLMQKRDVFVEAKKMLNEKMLEEKELLQSFLEPPYLHVYI